MEKELKEALSRVTTYLAYDEEESFEEWVRDGEDHTKHIYWDVLLIENKLLDCCTPDEFLAGLKEAIAKGE